MKRLIQLAISAFLTVGLSCSVLANAASSALGQMKVGVVNMMTVFSAVPQGQAKVNMLKSQLHPDLTALNTNQEKLKEKLKNFNRDSAAMSASDRSAEQAKLLKEQQSFQTKLLALQTKTTQEEQKAAEIFNKDVSVAVQSIAKSGKYDLIINSQAVPYSSAKFDVSDQVIAILNKDKS